MKPKKKLLSVTAAILGVFIVIGVFCFMKSWQIDNVFDEMYISVKYPHATKTRFGFVPEINRLVSEPEMEDFHWGGYKKTLNKGERISLSLHTNSATISITASMEIKNSSCLHSTCSYDYTTKILTLNPITILTYGHIDFGEEEYIDNPVGVAAFLNENNVTREMVEQYQHYFLYEKLLTAWVNGNGEDSRFSMDDLGEFTIVDNTFSQLGEDWGR